MRDLEYMEVKHNNCKMMHAPEASNIVWPRESRIFPNSTDTSEIEEIAKERKVAVMLKDDTYKNLQYQFNPKRPFVHQNVHSIHQAIKQHVDYKH